jgi:anti-sigma B factor antagonist
VSDSAPASEPALDVRPSSIDGAHVLTVRGELDVVTAPVLVEAIGTALAAAPSAIVVDLLGVEFLASAGMSVLFKASQTATDASTWFGVVADGPATSRPMKIVGLDQELRLYVTMDDALRAVG